MAPKATLTYFKLRGLCEPIRFLMAYSGMDWQEVGIDFETFPGLKSTYPYGKLPTLELDGKLLHQSAAICRYLARKVGLTGKDEWDSLQCDVMYDTISDFRMMLLSFFYEPHEESKQQKKEAALNVSAPMYLSRLEDHVTKNGGYFVNGQLTWVDVAYAALIDYMSFMAGKDLLEGRPALRGVRDRVFALPAIKLYTDKRPDYPY